MKVLVIADDFTGANDTGIAFHQQVLSVDVILDWQANHASQADVLVVNTDSRALSPQQAQHRIQSVLIENNQISTKIFKKIDSTLRGNVGAELEALLQYSNNSTIFLCSALPQVKRTIKNGICYVGKYPLLDTEFATDPKTPILSSNVREIVQKQTALSVIEITLEQLRSANIQAQLQQQLSQNAPCIVSFDAEIEQDLTSIVALSAEFEQVVLAGSSGLGLAMAAQLKVARKPILFALGSMSETTAQQADYLCLHHNVAMIEIAVERLFEPNAQNQYISQILTALQRNQDVVVKTISDLAARTRIPELCEQYQCTRAQLGERICTQFSAIIANIIEQKCGALSAIFLTGGDIAIGVATALNANQYRISGEIETGVPVGYFTNEHLRQLPVITKAGGFGSPQVLEKVIHFITH